MAHWLSRRRRASLEKMLVMLRSATEDSSFPRLALVVHGRREEHVRGRAEERVGVDLILPGVHGHPPVQHLHNALAHTGCGAKRCEVEAVGL